MGEWKTYRLGDLCDSISNTYRGKAQNVVLINTSDVLEGKCLNHRKEPNKNLKGQFKKTFQQGDILYSEIRPSNKRFAYIDFDATDYIASTKLMVLRANEKIRPLYLYYILQSQVVIDELQMLAESRSGTFPQITFSELSLLTTELPDIDSQDKIINILKSLDDKIELNRRINANLEAQAQALFRSWFVDFEPFRDGPFVDSELGKIPQGWKVGAASEFYKNITIGKTPPRKEHQWFSKESHDIVWVSIADMGNCGLSICNSSEYLTPEAIKKFNICIVPVNTVLLSFKLTIGRVAIADKELATNEAIAHFQTQHNTLEYTYLALKNYEFSSLGSTSSIATAVNSKIIKSMPWMMPSDDVLNQFHNVLSPIFNGIRNNIQEITYLSALRDTLLPKLIAGEINIENQ